MGPAVRELFSEDQIELDLHATSQAEALRELAALFKSHADVLNLDAFHGEIIARENVCSTCTGSGLAFPHARTDFVRKIVGAAGRSRAGVLCGNGERVHLFFMIGTPKSQVCEYLVCLASLAKKLRDEKLRDALLNAATGQEFLHALAGGGAADR